MDQNPWAPPSWMGSPSQQPQEQAEAFTLPAQEVPRDLWLPKPPAQRTVPRPKIAPLQPRIILPSLIFLALLSAFFSWVSAEPLWLALGHGQTGTATVTRCVGEGLTQRCIGEMDGVRVTLHGVTTEVGSRVVVKRVGPQSHQAYAGGLFLRWFLGLAMVLACGAGIGLVTRSRDRAAWGTSLAAPLLVTIGFLAATF